MPQPNIILIITDQQRFDTINALGFPYMDTPNLDRLVREGVSFDNCFITAPSCAPSRASLFTGYYPHITGVLQNADLWRRSWVELLAKSGYHCVNIGKMHTFPYETPLGFHERYVVENKDRYLEGRYYFDEWDKALKARGHVKQQRELYRERPDYRERLGAFEWELPEDLHADNFVGDFATWWLKNYPKTQPLFMEIGFPGPHPPYDPVKRYADPYMEKDLPRQEIRQDDLDNQPTPYKQMREHNFRIDHDSVVHLPDPSEAQRQRQRAYYLANVTMIDEKVGEILQTLDEQGYLDNAVVIFTSDHGDCLTDHGHSQKWTMYDTITRVPTIIWSPDESQPGRRISGLCQLMDLGPTVLELAGITPPEMMQAQSLRPALQGEDWTGRDYVFAEHPADGIYEGPYMTMVRNRRWKLVHFADTNEGQLFDLENDPNEFHNLWDAPEAADRKHELLDVLLNWRINSSYETRRLFSQWR
ncbi:MAG: sulfatase-like hydrolase/transferase [Anaerolineae bacterium]|nr:sulfatase-like hydrolase/transferase [Anaerolineae bacterium]